MPHAFGAAAAPALRLGTLSSTIVTEVREALFEKKLKPRDFLGTEKELSLRYRVSRIVARDALKRLEALGIVEIRVGAGGGARIAQGNPRLFAEALAVQLELIGVSAGEILDAQHAIECLAAERAAEHATAEEIVRLRHLLAEAEKRLGDLDAFTRSSLAFHLGIAEASHNRVLVVQLVSLQHVSWPNRNRTLTRKLAQHILEVHGQILERIEKRDAVGARRLMDAHVDMIRDRRTAERGEKRIRKSVCC